MIDSPQILLLILIIGVFAALAGTVGIGGGALYTPMFMIIGGLSITSAFPLSSITIVGTALASTLINMKKKTINYKLALTIEPFTIIGSIVGIQILLIVPDIFLFTIFSVIMVLLTIRMISRTMKVEVEDNKDNKVLTSNQLKLAIVGSFLAGILSGLVGIGGGLIKVPMLTELGLCTANACGTGSFMVLFTSISTSIQFIFYNKLDLTIGIIFLFVGFFASFIGTYISRTFKRTEILTVLLTAAIGISTFLILYRRFLM